MEGTNNRDLATEHQRTYAWLVMGAKMSVYVICEKKLKDLST